MAYLHQAQLTAGNRMELHATYAVTGRQGTAGDIMQLHAS